MFITEDADHFASRVANEAHHHSRPGGAWTDASLVHEPSCVQCFVTSHCAAITKYIPAMCPEPLGMFEALWQSHIADDERV